MAAAIPFPGAAVAPVANPQRKAPYNKVVRPIKLGLSARAWRLKREADAARRAAEARSEYQRQREYVQQLRDALWAGEIRLELLAAEASVVC